MFEGKKIGVVVPCYNEQTQIAGVLATMPDYVDCVIVVDDGSKDGTADAIRQYIASAAGGQRVVLLEQKNQGVGRAICNGYRESVRRGMNVVAVMAGDGQMDPRQLRLVIAPVAADVADYAKVNRLYYRRAWEMIPRKRYLGNAFLSMLTKIASGYWSVADSQTGYTAITDEAINAIDLDAVYPRYGYPNDMLVRLNVCNFRVVDVPVRPIYGVGEQSKMRMWKVIPTMSWMIFKRFCWRMWQKYVIRDFHPLVFFYAAAMILFVLSVVLFGRMAWTLIEHGRIGPINAVAWAFCTVSMAQFALFAMWFDMEVNKDLNPRLTRRQVDRARNGEATARAGHADAQAAPVGPANRKENGNPAGPDQLPAA